MSVCSALLGGDKEPKLLVMFYSLFQLYQTVKHSKKKKTVLTLKKVKFYHATQATYSRVISALDRSRFYSAEKSNSDTFLIMY